ncbi:MAG TPA: hypothetical protein DDW31_04850 [candidate division Zixibacteria bacterium]|nr:hypothetical protein [candidate division Zixibacteria bacterium]
MEQKMDLLSGNRTSPSPPGKRRQAWTAALGILAALAVGLALSLVLAGCGKSPVEAPTTTVITGTASVTISGANGWRADYSFRSGGYTYGKISLFSPDQSTSILEANGIQEGSGTTAPADGYSTSAQAILGHTYFIKTDAVPHYGRISVIGLNQVGKYTSITVNFDWVVQTEGGNRSLQ